MSSDFLKKVSRSREPLEFKVTRNPDNSFEFVSKEPDITATITSAQMLGKIKEYMSFCANITVKNSYYSVNIKPKDFFNIKELTKFYAAAIPPSDDSYQPEFDEFGRVPEKTLIYWDANTEEYVCAIEGVKPEQTWEYLGYADSNEF